jgi:SpoVK/Ycf46/Vps4 family AAA+-type ATPase
MPSAPKISFATKIIPQHSWADVVLPNDKKEQIHEIINCVAHRAEPFEVGNHQKYSRRAGLNILFSGPSEADETMAVEVIASELKLDVFRIDLSMVVSKSIGETEKNLNRIFKDAENCDAILFFDEADALFGKRSEVKDAHNRYANIEINFLLQKMEEHIGIVILATNKRENIDESFLRRMNFIMDFKIQNVDWRLNRSKNLSL